ILEAKFNNVMTLCTMLPLLLCTRLNSFLHSRVSQYLRVMGILLVIMLIFIITTIIVKVHLEPLPFFAVTMGSLFGMTGLLPVSYTTPIISGITYLFSHSFFFPSFSVGGSELHDAAFGYFITACGYFSVHPLLCSAALTIVTGSDIGP
uniref:Uncharacterized protein n=1 Tax=Mola mola TaxID=94237 RepID=A0A3Q3X9F4_MOLML